MSTLNNDLKNKIDETITQCLDKKSYHWLITGVAGFIGSHLLQTLLCHDQTVVGIDNFIVGDDSNLENVKNSVSKKQWSQFRFIEQNICDLQASHPALKNIDFILHHAALGSVPDSIERPQLYHKNNVGGFLNTLELTKKLSVKKLVYASSSAVYGQNNFTLQKEDVTGKLLSPYAATKITNEAYAQTWHSCYDLPVIGFRYFNIFGSRQDPRGSYAAVIPKWINCLLNNTDIEIYGNGLQVRDFCHVQNVVLANIKACLTNQKEHGGQVFNISAGEPINLTSLAQILIQKLSGHRKNSECLKALYVKQRPGDINHSQADISKVSQKLKYKPLINLEQGLDEAIGWYLEALIDK